MLFKNRRTRRFVYALKKKAYRCLRDKHLLFILAMALALMVLVGDGAWPAEKKELILELKQENALTVVQNDNCEEILQDAVMASVVGHDSKMVYHLTIGKERLDPPPGNRLNGYLVQKYVVSGLALKVSVKRKGCDSRYDIINSISVWRHRWTDITDSFYTRGVILGTK